jgi:hypothetical protein
MNTKFTPLITAILIFLGMYDSVRAADNVRPVTREGQRASAEASASARPAVDLQARPLDWIAPGTVIGETAVKGWTHLVLIATPRIGVGDIEAIPRTAVKYSNLFRFTILANVRSSGTGDARSFYLDRVAIGGASEINGRNVIISSEQTFGSDLGFIGKRIFQENESILQADVRQVVRTRTMLVFDAQGFVLYNRKHARMVMRHVILVSPHDGKLSSFVWLMGADGRNGYALAERTLQLLPPGLREDRVLSVDANKFTLGIPANDAFALAHIPRGTPVEFTPTLGRLAATRRFTAETALELEAELQSRYAPMFAATDSKNPRR